MSDYYVSMSVSTTKASRDKFSELVIGRGFKQQHFVANLIVWASMDDVRIRVAYRKFRKMNKNFKDNRRVYDTCISTPRILVSERDKFKERVASYGFKQREVLIGLIETIIHKPKLIDKVAYFRDDLFKKDLTT